MLYAMFTLVLWTQAIIIITARARMRSVNSEMVPLQYYELMSGADVPDFIAKSGRNISNLFEMPVLFYAAGATYLALALESSMPVNAAWAFVISRVVHSLIHLTYNKIMHRMLMFAFGNLCVLAMWLGIVQAA